MRYIYALFLSLLFTPILYAQLTFTRIDLNYPLDGIEDVTSFDLGEDGDQDLVAASVNDDKVTLFRQVGFLEPTVLTTSLESADKINIEDLDMDGDDDIIASGYGQIFWWENTNGNYGSAKEIVSLGDTFEDFVVFDIDGDGDMDIVSVEFSIAAGPGYLALWQNEGMVFSRVVLSDNAIDGRSIRVTDLDVDGDLDFVIGEGLGNKIAFWSNEGNLNYSKSTITGVTVCVSMNLGDIDGDGDLDIVASSFTGDYLVLMVNKGQLQFDRKVFETSHDGPDESLFYDLDVDGDMDIVACFYNADLLVFYEQTDSLVFEKQIIDSNFGSARDIHISDLNNDQVPDILGASLSLDKMVIWVNELVLSTPAGIERNNPVTIIPNPARDEIHVFHSGLAGTFISIYTMDGKQQLTLPYQEKLDISALNPGQYILTVRDDRHQHISSSSFIKY